MDSNKKMISLLSEAHAALSSCAITVFGGKELFSPVIKGQLQQATEPLLHYLSYIVRQYKDRPEILLSLYEADKLWQIAIRKMLRMDDEDDGAFWYGEHYKNVPNVLLRIYLADHPAIGMQKILEMFEHGYTKDFIALNLSLQEILDENLEDSIKEVLFVIEERLDDGRGLMREKETIDFLIFLSSIRPRIIDTFVRQCLEESEDNLSQQLFASKCQAAIELANESNPSQHKLNLETT